MEKPRITEVRVRMDCNGCVQKIKKALHSVPGIHDLYIDLPQQKIMIIGSADSEKIVKAIKKTRKSAIICSRTELEDSNAPIAENASDEGRTMEHKASAAQPAPPAEPPKNLVQPSQPPLENLPSEINPSPEEKQSSDSYIAASQPAEPLRPRDVKQVHVVYHYQPDYKYRYDYGQSHSYGHGFSGSTSTNPTAPVLFPQQPSTQYATHNYNTSRAAPPLPEYATINDNTYRSEPPSPQYASQHYNSYRQEPPQQQYVTHNYNAYRDEPPPSQYATCYNIYRPDSSLPLYAISNDNASKHGPPSIQYATHNANGSGPPLFGSETQNDNTSWSQPAPPLYVTHNRNTYSPEAHPVLYANLNQTTYRPSPYVNQYEYIRPSPQYSHYSRAMQYSEDINYDYGNISSVFSDENPNSCTIV